MQCQYFLFLIFAALLVGTFGANLIPGSTRVVGGQTAAVGEFPFIVSLRQYNSHFCGGSIISNNYVITAAHCVYGSSASSVTVVAGTNSLSSGGTRYAVSRITVHSGYNPYTISNDIALLRVSTPFIFTSTVQNINLPLQGETTGAGVASIAIGWGYTSYPSWSLSNNLQKVDLTVQSNTVCQYYLGSNVFSTSICASAGYGKGVCHGDSGGPLISGRKLIGLVSWGRPCAVGYPDVYTRVSEFITWVNQNAV